MFNFGKAAFLEKNSEYLSKLITEPKALILQYYKSLEAFEWNWALAKVSDSRKNPDCRRIAQSCCEMLIDASLKESPSEELFIKNKGMDIALVKLMTAKIAATLIKQNLFEGSDIEKQLFRMKLDAFLRTNVKNVIGQSVTLMEFAQDPSIGLPITEAGRNKLFNR